MNSLKMIKKKKTNFKYFVIYFKTKTEFCLNLPTMIIYPCDFLFVATTTLIKGFYCA